MHDFDSIVFMETIQASFDYPKWENSMGEARRNALRLNFDRIWRFGFAKIPAETW